MAFRQPSLNLDTRRASITIANETKYGIYGVGTVKSGDGKYERIHSLMRYLTDQESIVSKHTSECL